MFRLNLTFKDYFLKRFLFPFSANIMFIINDTKSESYTELNEKYILSTK